MSEKKWIETKKECEVDELGNQKTVRITLEPDNGDKNKSWWSYIDNWLKLVGLIAIAGPFILFSYQQKEENNRLKATRQVDVYSEASVTLHSLLAVSMTNEKVENLKFKLFYETYPKIGFLNDSTIISKLDSLKPALDYYLKGRNLITQLAAFNTFKSRGLILKAISQNSSGTEIEKSSISIKFDSLNYAFQDLQSAITDFIYNDTIFVTQPKKPEFTSDIRNQLREATHACKNLLDTINQLRTNTKAIASPSATNTPPATLLYSFNDAMLALLKSEVDYNHFLGKKVESIDASFVKSNNAVR